jgi:hypothetical protein
MAKKSSKASAHSRTTDRRGESVPPEPVSESDLRREPPAPDPMDELLMTDEPARKAPGPRAIPANAPSLHEAPPPRAMTGQREASVKPSLGQPPVREQIAERVGSSPSPKSDPVVTRWRFGRNELVALSGFALLVVLSAIWFFRCLFAHPAELGIPEIPKQFPLPLQGQFITIAEAATGWRDRAESDRARAEEVVLPTVSVKLDPSRSKQGFLRVEFIDTDGKIRGDIATVEFAGGRFKDNGRGEKLSADGTEVTVTGTVGFNSRSLFTVYLAGEETRWSIRLREGPDYSNGPWSLLGQARVSDRKL